MYIKLAPSVLTVEPIGIGTPMVESLFSYVMRLAAANNLDTWAFICSMESLIEGDIKVTFDSIMNGLGHLNFGTKALMPMEEVIARLSGERNVSMLTAKSLYAVFGSSLMRPKRWFNPNDLDYEPLLYSIRQVYWTPEGIPLETFCHCCRRRSCSARSWHQIGECPECSRPLDDYDMFTLFNFEKGLGFYEEKDFGLWCAKEIGELLAYTSTRDDLNFKEAAMSLLQFNDISECIGTANSALLEEWAWQDANPIFEQFLRFCYDLNIRPKQFFAKNFAGMQCVAA